MPYRVKTFVNIAAAALCFSLMLTGCAGSDDPEATPLPTVQLEPALTAPPTPTPTPKPSIGPYYEPTVTKSPGAEEKVEGSCIYFSAFAEDAVRCEWELVADEGYVSAENAPAKFDGLFVAGAHDSYLVLGNIPLELDGWSVRCKFIGTGDATVYSDTALINVLERTVNIHGAERKTVKGTGNVEGFGAEIDFEGENWWDVEEYSDSTFVLSAQDTDSAFDIKAAEFCIYSDGSVSLVLGEKTYLGTVSEKRLGGYSASATVKATGSGDELVLYFDYTSRSKNDETWNKIYIQFALISEQSAEEVAVEDDAAAAETAAEPVQYELILVRQ